MAKMTMKQWEKSPMDKKIDKASGFKEGSKKDRALDKVAKKMCQGKKQK
jgi:hypothetical protein